MKYIIFLYISLYCATLAAASPMPDSVLAEIERSGRQPEKLFDIYYKLASATDNTAQSIEYVLKAKEIAGANNLAEQSAKSAIFLAAAYIEAGRLDDAKTAIQDGLSRSLSLGNDKLIYHAYRNIATIYRREANFDSSLYYYLACARLAEEKLSDTMVSSIYSSLGGYFVTIGNLDEAESYHKKALQLRLAYNHPTEIATSYDNLGIVCREREDYKKALDYYNKAREIYMTLGDSQDISFIYNDIGAIYSKMGITDSGEYFLQKSIGIRERNSDLIELAYTYNYLGENYERKGNLSMAESFIKKALNLAIQIKNNKQHYQALESLSDFYARNKMYDSAYHYLQLYKSYRDSIRKLDNEKLIADLNTRYQAEKKEKQIQEQQFELSRKNYILGGIVLFMLAAGSLGYSYYRRSRLQQQAILQAEVMKQQELATRAVLEAEENERQRIAGDLHDGVGQMMSAAKMNLSAISSDVIFQSDAQKQRFENALKLVDDSCAEVRNVSHNIMPNSLLRNSLAAAVRTFISKIDEDVIKINLHTEGLNEHIDENTEIMLYRVIQECVNNVIKHARANTLDITLVREESNITATIEDNGVGFDTKDKSKFDGIGMKNIRSRVGFLKGDIEWDSAPGRGTVVTIHIPSSQS